MEFMKKELEDIEKQIDAVTIVLDSFADYRKNPEKREDYLETFFSRNNHVKTFFSSTPEHLHTALNQLRVEKIRLLTSFPSSPAIPKQTETSNERISCSEYGMHMFLRMISMRINPILHYSVMH